MLEIRNLSKRYGDQLVVRELSLEVEKGQILVLLGKSGSGKTTTLKMINRLIEPSGGQIFVEGSNVLELPPEQLRRGIGYVIQENGLFPHYTVAENIGVVPRLLGWNKGKVRSQVDRMLSMLDLAPESYRGKYPHQLSGGQQQRVAIARALAAEPPLLLMDEPFSALDPITRARARRKFQELVARLDITVVLVTHDVVEAIDLGDRIALLEQGALAQLGSPGNLLFRPESEFVHRFFKGNRLELELRSARIQEILPLLEKNAPSDGEEPAALRIAQRDNLMQVLEAMAEEGVERAYLQGHGWLGREELLRTYFRWKDQLAN